MGFILFNASGTFSPLDYGLNVGDIINIVCVGGGGGGGIGNSSYPGTGGTGGTSSFGSFVTALGGSGGAYYGGTPGIQGQFIGGLNYGGNCGGGGAGGWIPGVADWGGNGGNGLYVIAPNGSSTMGIMELTSPVGSAGAGGVYGNGTYTLYYGATSATCYASGIRYISPGRYCIVPTEMGAASSNNTLILCGNARSGLHFGGGGGARDTGLFYLPTGSGSDQYSGYRYFHLAGCGGSGYGAGGGGGNYVWRGYSSSYYGGINSAGNGGNSGQVRYAAVTLTGTGSIAASVGGGGGGGGLAEYYYSSSNSYSYNAGNAGSAGAAGIAGSYGTAGGYAGTGGEQKVTTLTYGSNTPYYTYGAGGGGAGGCVAVFW